MIQTVKETKIEKLQRVYDIAKKAIRYRTYRAVDVDRKIANIDAGLKIFIEEANMEESFRG